MNEFSDKLTRITDLIPREERFFDAPNKIKVAIGMRRTGKTYFLYQKILLLLKEGINLSQILYINFEDDRLQPLNGKKLANLIESFYTIYPENHDQRCYLFLDEIQNIEDWPTVIRRFHDSKNVEIYLTGSSAKLLSKEIATNLRGRSLSTEIWPYSFREFLTARKIKIEARPLGKKSLDILTNSFMQYLSTGGFPEVNNYSKEARQQTLQDYVNIVTYRDIIERHDIKNPTFIRYMILSLIHNTSKPFTVNKFYNDAKSQGYKVGKDAVYDYAAFIEDSFLAFFVPIHDPSIRKVQINAKKIYCIDPGLVRAVTLDYEKDLGKLFENIIYLELRRMGYKINYYLTRERFEVDFLVESPQGKKKLFQVVWHTEQKDTMVREERALNSAISELGIDGEIITLDSYLRYGISI